MEFYTTNEIFIQDHPTVKIEIITEFFCSFNFFLYLKASFKLIPVESVILFKFPYSQPQCQEIRF